MSAYPSRSVAFDADAIHQAMMDRPDYLGCPHIGTVLEWRDDPKASNADKVFYTDEDMGLVNDQGALMCMVATVLPDRVYAKSTGSYNPAWKAPLSDAKIQLSFGPPIATSPALERDFHQAVATLNALQHAVAATAKHEHLLMQYKGQPAVRLSMPIFRPRETPFDGNNASDPILTYPVPPEYGQALFDTAHNFELNPLRIFDINNRAIAASVLESHLVGAVVEVTFQLQHYAMKGQGKFNGPAVSDTFTGRFVQLRVLRAPSAPGPSSFYSRSLDMGAYVPQGSTSFKARRAEIAAARAATQSPGVHAPAHPGAGPVPVPRYAPALLPSPVVASDAHARPPLDTPTASPYPLTPDATPPRQNVGPQVTPQTPQQTTLSQLFGGMPQAYSTPPANTVISGPGVYNMSPSPSPALWTNSNLPSTPPSLQYGQRPMFGLPHANGTSMQTVGSLHPSSVFGMFPPGPPPPAPLPVPAPPAPLPVPAPSAAAMKNGTMSTVAPQAMPTPVFNASNAIQDTPAQRTPSSVDLTQTLVAPQPPTNGLGVGPSLPSPPVAGPSNIDIAAAQRTPAENDRHERGTKRTAEEFEGEGDEEEGELSSPNGGPVTRSTKKNKATV